MREVLGVPLLPPTYACSALGYMLKSGALREWRPTVGGVCLWSQWPGPGAAQTCSDCWKLRWGLRCPGLWELGPEMGTGASPPSGPAPLLLREMRDSRGLGRLVSLLLGCSPFIRVWAPKPLMPKEWELNVECRCWPSGSSDVPGPGMLSDGSELPGLSCSGPGCWCGNFGEAAPWCQDSEVSTHLWAWQRCAFLLGRWPGLLPTVSHTS